MSINSYNQLNIFDFLKKQEKSLNIATMCSGVGTPEIAFNELNIDTNIIFACEIDPFARKTYKANHEINDVSFYFDIASFDASKYLGQIDILVFGSPCQPFSIAGFRKGFEDPRGKVFFDGIKRINECKPEIVIFENVKGLTTHEKGMTYEIVKNSFKEIGYTIQFKVFNSLEHGSTQKRERLFIVAFKDSEAALNFDINDFEMNITSNYFVDYLDRFVDSKYYLSGNAKNFMHELVNDSNRIEKNNILKSRWEHCNINETFNKNNYTITASYKNGYPHNVLVFNDSCKHGFWTCDHVYTEICDSCDLEDCLNFDDNNFPTAACRRMTPRECARLTGYPDKFIFPVSDTQAYKQIGNSMEVNTLKDLFFRICTFNFERVLNV